MGEGVRNVKFQVGANPNQVINIGLKDFSYNLGVPAVASEIKITLSGLTEAQNFRFTIGETNIDFSTTRAISGQVMTEEELVDFEKQITQAITNTTGYSNVSVSRVGNDLFIRDSEGRSISAASALKFEQCIEGGGGSMI